MDIQMTTAALETVTTELLGIGLYEPSRLPAAVAALDGALGGAIQELLQSGELTGKKGWVIVHRCRRCGEVRRNKAALDDPRQPDDVAVLARVASGAVPGRM